MTENEFNKWIKLNSIRTNNVLRYHNLIFVSIEELCI